MSKPHGIDEIDLTVDSESDDESEFCEVTDEDDEDDDDDTNSSAESEKESQKPSNRASPINLGSESAIHRWRNQPIEGEISKEETREDCKFPDLDVGVIMSEHSSVAVELGSPRSGAVGDFDGGIEVIAEPVSDCAKVPPPSPQQRPLMNEEDVPVAGPSQVPIIRSTSVSPMPMEGPSHKCPHLVHFASASSVTDLRSAPNVWRELSHDEEHTGKRELSREVQEAQVMSLHNRGVAAMRKGHKWTAIDCFQRIFSHTSVRELCPTDWTTFDWAAARKRWSQCSHGKRLGDVQTVLLSTSMAMVELAENPVPFYLQALSIRPDATDLWFELGQYSTQSGLWQVAQFAFEHCGNQFRACEALLLLHFIQRDYHKCVPMLREVLSQCADHLVANVLREELTRENPSSLWKGMLDSCPSCSIEVDIGDSRERVLSKIDCVRQHVKAHRTQSTSVFKNPFIAENGTSTLRYQPLIVRVDRNDISIAGLGRKLCNVFDRIQEFSSFAMQKVAFECPSTSQPNSMYGDSHGMLLDVVSTEFELTPGMKRQLAARGAPVDVDQRVVGDLLEELVCICVDGLPSPLQPKIDVGGKRSATNAGRKPSEGNEPAKKRRLDIDEADDALRRRRSTRFLENLDDPSTTAHSLPVQLQPPAESESQGVEHEWELHEIVQARKGADVVPCITPSLPHPRPPTPPLIPSSAVNKASGEYVVGLAKMLVNAGTSSVDQLTHEFLHWISNHPRSLSGDDLEIVRQIYLRWIDVASPVGEGDIDDLPIHVAAAELGSSRALYILHHYFSPTLVVADDKGGEEMMESVVEVGRGERENYESARLNHVRIKSARKRKKFEEEKRVSLSERTLCTLFGTACNSRQQDSIPLESLASEESASVKVSQQLPAIAMSEDAVPTSATPMRTLRVCGRGLDLAEKITHRRMEVRYRCILSRGDCGTNADSADATLQMHRQSLELARAAVDGGEKFLAYGRDGGTFKISKGHIEKMLERLNESLHTRRMDALRANGDYDELERVLLNKHNWHASTEFDQAEHMLLLCECALKTGRPEVSLEWSLRTLQLVRARKSLTNRHAKAILKRCVAVTEELLSSSASLPDVQLKLASGILADLLLVPPFNKSISLWTLLYEVVRRVEGELTEQALRSYYVATEGVSGRMPCRSLMVLARAHRVVGEAEKCHRKGGRFLRFYLDELHRVVSREWFSRICLGDGGRDAGSQYEDILTNVAEEVYQIICCVFTDQQWSGREEYARHWSHLKWRADWPMALKVVALLMPRELPELYATEYDVDERFADVMNAIFPFVLRVSEEEEQRFSHFLARRPVSLWPSTSAPGDELSAQELFKVAMEEMMGEDPRGDLLTFADGVSEERQRILTTQSRVLYALSCWYYVNGGPSVEEELRCITSCLAICAPFLDDELQSAVWLVFGRRLTKRYSRLGDSGLLDRAEEWLFPFKVSLLLKRDFSETHLDLATLIYQIRTRLMRYSSREGVTDGAKERIGILTASFLPQCRMHCELAIRYNGRTENEEEEEWVGNINWISHYLMAKIAEKLQEPVAEVMRLYHLCALSLECEGYKYPSRINKERQEHFEPLEVHYKVHSYALKKVRELIRTASVNGVERTRTMLLEIEAHLRRFGRHGVAITVEGKSAPEFYQHVDEQPSPHNNVVQPGDEEVAKLTLDSMLEIVETQENIRTTCRKAFELISAKFPHYKSIYRIAEEAYFNGDYSKAWKTLLEAFYGGAKKRSMQTPLSAENIIEIHRTDIERGGSLCYHTVKIMRLAAATAFKCAELERLVQLTVGLLPLRNEEDVSEKLSEHDVKAMRNDHMEKIVALVAKPAGDVKAVAHVIELLQCLMKRFRKEGYHDEAAKLTQYLSEWTRRKNNLLEPPVQHVKPTQKSPVNAGEPTKCPPSTTPPIANSTHSNSAQIGTSIEELTRELTPLVLRLKSLPPKERNECLNMLRERGPEYFKKLELFARLSSTVITQSNALGTPPSASTTNYTEGPTNSSEAQKSTETSKSTAVRPTQERDTRSTSSCPSVSSACSPLARMAVSTVSSSSAKRQQTSQSVANPGNSPANLTSSKVPSDAGHQVSPAKYGPSPCLASPQYSAAATVNKVRSSTPLERPYVAETQSTPPSQSQSRLPEQSSVTVNREIQTNPMRAQLLQSPIPSTSRYPTTPTSNHYWENRRSVELPIKRPPTSHPTGTSVEGLFQNRVSFLGIDGQPSPAKRLKTAGLNVTHRVRAASSTGGPVPELIVIEGGSPTKELAHPSSTTYSGRSPTYQDILNRLGVSQLGDVESSRSTTPQKSVRRSGSAQAHGMTPLHPLLAPFNQNTEHQSGVLQAQLDHIEKQRNLSSAQLQAQLPSANSFAYQRVGASPSDGTSTSEQLLLPLSQKPLLGSPTAMSYTHLATGVNRQGQPTTIFHTTPTGTVQREPGSPQTDIPPHFIAGSSQSTFNRK